MSTRRLAVLGSPIEHSLSPRLHSAAYAALGWDAEYSRHEIGRGGLDAFVAGLGGEWRGLSLTMPLKDEGWRRADELDEAARLTGAVNTLGLGGRVRGFNTDVPGIVDAFGERGVTAGEHAVLLGAGATARSVVLALERLGVASLDVLARRPEAAREVVAFAADVGLAGRVSDPAEPLVVSGLVASTLPGDARPDLPALRIAGEAALFDVAYSDTGSAVHRWWRDAGGVPAPVDGLDMLIGQALRQVRVFVGDDVDAELPDEAAVREAMRAAVGRS